MNLFHRFTALLQDWIEKDEIPHFKAFKALTAKQVSHFCPFI